MLVDVLKNAKLALVKGQFDPSLEVLVRIQALFFVIFFVLDGLGIHFVIDSEVSKVCLNVWSMEGLEVILCPV